MPQDEARARFSGWLSTTMQTRGLSQAQLARSVGVADTQVSRWRRGQVVPTVQYLQRIADTFGVQRTTLDRLVGYPVASGEPGADSEIDADVEAELQALQARLREAMQSKLPRTMWRAYVDACIALADGLGSSARKVVRESMLPLSERGGSDSSDRPLGFQSGGGRS
jgi:transcriptional regulator with XRE-family HTH domain